MKFALSILLIFAAICPFYGQGAHRFDTVLVRGQGVAANLAPNAKILVCVAGTNCNTLQPIYYDLALTQLVHQPLTADSSGVFSYYVTPGCYDEQYSSPGLGTTWQKYVCSFSGTAGTGSVTSFSSGNLSPLFTTSVLTATTTPALTFTLSNAAQNSVLAGPASGGAGAPSYQTAPTFSAANLTNFPTFNQNTTGNAATATALAATPTLCSTGNAPTGILANGNATGCASIGGGGSSAFSALTSGTNTTAAMLVGTGASLGVAGSGTIVATSAPYSGLTGSVPTWNQNTTGSAAKWTTARLLAGNSVDGSANVPFANNFVVQGTSDAGLSGAQFLGALSTGLLKNTTTTGVLSVAAAGTDYLTPTGSSVGLSQATTSAFGVVKCDGTTITCTAGVIASISGGSGTVTHTAGALTALQVVIGNGSADIKVDTGCSTDGAGTETCLAYNASGATPGKTSWGAGTGSIPTLLANSAGFAAPVTGGTSYLFKLPATITVGILHAAAPATNDGVNESALTSSAVSLTADVSGLLPVANGGTGTSSPALVAGTNVSITGSWPNQTINATAGSGGDTITSPQSTIVIGGTSTNTTLDVAGAAGKILNGSVPSLTYTPVLGVDNTSSGTMQLANGFAAAHTIWGSASTTTNTILGFATVPTNGHIVTCASSGTVCTLTDGGAVPTGTVTSVAQSFTGGLISVGGSPITSSGTLALTVAGTSGGVPYFSSTSAWASSGLLPTGDFVLGGGAGGAPTATFSIVPAANGGTAVANTASLTLGTSNQNWATLGTGIVKNTTTTGALSLATSSDVLGLCTTCVTSAASLTSNATVLGAGSQGTKVVAGLTTDGTSIYEAGVAGTSVGKFQMFNATSGSITLAPTTGALGSVTATLPANTGTVAELNLAQTFSALQTFGTNISIGGVTAGGATGTGNVVFSSSPTLVTPTLGAATATSINGTTIPSSVTLTQTIASGTSALGTGAIASGACATAVTTTATGTATTDVVPWGFNGDPTAVTGYSPTVNGMLTIIAYPSSGNVNFKVCNNTASSITPGAITLNWRIVR